MAADAGFVPCAESGISSSLRCSHSCVIHLWYSRITITPVYSPWAPAAGWSVTASIPVISASHCSSSHISSNAPWHVDASCNGCSQEKPLRPAAKSLTTGLYFIVQLPRGYVPDETEKFICDRRVKWRMTWSSETSGREGGWVRSISEGSIDFKEPATLLISLSASRSL